MSNSVLCVQCGKWIHGRCAGMKMATAKSSRNATCRKCEWNIREAVVQKERIYDEVETVWEFTYLSDRVGEGGEYEAAVIVRTRCVWVRLRECGE